jgi:hypothetical protein
MVWEPGHPERREPPPVEKRVWVVVKAARSAQAIERAHPLGRELRVIYAGSLLWSEVFRPTDARTLDDVADEHLGEWLRRGWELGS